MNPRIPSLLVLASFALAAPACRSSAPEASIAESGGESEGTLSAMGVSDQRIVLAVTDLVDVDIETFGGDVTVHGDSDDATVSLERTGAFAWGRADEEKASLGDIRYTVSLTRGADGRETILVRAVTDNPEPYYQSCAVDVRVPKLGTVRVRSGRGRVEVIDNRGNFDIATSRGKVRVMTPWKIEGPVAVVNDGDDIDIRVRGESEGLIDAETRVGRVRSHIRFADYRILDEKNDEDTLVAELNDGKKPWVIRNAHGDIDFSVIPEPVTPNPFAIAP
jgi:hypothetical protein